MVTTIGSLDSMPEESVYRRKSGDLFLKLNERYHVQVKLGRNKDGDPVWIGDGNAEELDPSEEVEVVN